MNIPLLFAMTLGAWAAGPAAAPEPAAPTTADSTIREVVVYPQGARVTRRLRLDCAPGAIAAFTGIPAAADPASFRAQAGEASIEGLRWQARARPSALSPASRARERQLRSVAEQLAASRHQLERIESAADTRSQYKDTVEKMVGEQMAGGRPDLAAWSRALETVYRLQIEATRSEAQVTRRVRELEAREKALTAELDAQGEGSARKDYRVEVGVRCPAGRSAEVSLHYQVRDAGWTAAYEARTRDRERTVELAIQATVQQRTGEDWQGARVVLSTAAPRQDATPPSLAPLVIRARPGDGRPHAPITRSEEVTRTPGATAAASPDDGAPVTATAQGLSVQMTLPTLPLVPGDGRAVRLLVSRTRQPALIRLRAVPRLAAAVYRVTDLVNTAPFPLLPGAIDIYQDGSFLSRDQLGETPVRGRFTVTLGIEERVSVRRLVVQELQSTGGWPARARREQFAYRFQLTSHLPTPVQVDLLDHLPVSELADVPVKLDPRTTPGHQLDRRHGFIHWPVTVPAGSERRIDLAFAVHIPARYQQ